MMKLKDYKENNWLRIWDG